MVPKLILGHSILFLNTHALSFPVDAAAALCADASASYVERGSRGRGRQPTEEVSGGGRFGGNSGSGKVHREGRHREPATERKTEDWP